MPKIVNSGIARLAQALADEESVNIDTFIFAEIPGIAYTDEVPVGTTMPTIEQLKYEGGVTKRQYLDADSVLYSCQLGGAVGNFRFNFIGLYESATSTLIAAAYVPMQEKYQHALERTGNLLIKNFILKYSNIAQISGIDVNFEGDFHLLNRKAPKKIIVFKYEDDDEVIPCATYVNVDNDTGIATYIPSEGTGYVKITGIGAGQGGKYGSLSAGTTFAASGDSGGGFIIEIDAPYETQVVIGKGGSYRVDGIDTVGGATSYGNLATAFGGGGLTSGMALLAEGVKGIIGAGSNTIQARCYPNLELAIEVRAQPSAFGIGKGSHGRNEKATMGGGGSAIHTGEIGIGNSGANGVIIIAEY